MVNIVGYYMELRSTNKIYHDITFYYHKTNRLCTHQRIINIVIGKKYVISEH